MTVSSAIRHPPSIQEWFDSREGVRNAFLSGAGWDGAKLSPVGEDCAFRRYFRLGKKSETAILMETVPDGSAIATPGHSLRDFIRIGAFLRAAGLHTPEIYHADSENGYLLLEDFGDVSFKAELLSCQNPRELYALATDVLSFMRRKIGPGEIELPRYYDSHVHKGLRRIIDWYFPVARGRRNEDGLAEDYLAVWHKIEKQLPPCPQGFLHIDFHVENLMWLPPHPDPPPVGGREEKNKPSPHGGEGWVGGQGPLRACGILDFQGAMTGPLPYDLANLLEDARVDVDEYLRRAMLDCYCADMTAEEKDIFKNWYRVLATQFHCRVAGQFIRLAVRDGKDRYLAHLPRVARYLEEGLRHPVLKPLKEWFAAEDIDFRKIPVCDPARVGKFIRDDAF